MDFVPMTQIVPEAARGCAKVEHFIVSEHDSRISALRPGEYVPPGNYARLYVNGCLTMSDTRMEQITNYEVVSRSMGDVLIAGLGLGLILVPILKKREVRSVTVIEKYQDVIDLVAPHFDSPKLKIICADIFDWKPTKGQKFKVMYFDIWPDICVDNLEEIAKLHQRFKFYGDRETGYWMASWCQDELRDRRRRRGI